MAFGPARWIMAHTSAWVLWGGIVHALQRALLRDSSCRKCLLSLVSRDEERSTGVLEQLMCLCITCPSAFQVQHVPPYGAPCSVILRDQNLS